MVNKNTIDDKVIDDKVNNKNDDKKGLSFSSKVKITLAGIGLLVLAGCADVIYNVPGLPKTPTPTIIQTVTATPTPLYQMTQEEALEKLGKVSIDEIVKKSEGIIIYNNGKPYITGAENYVNDSEFLSEYFN